MQIKKQYFYLKIAIPVALSYWVIDSLIHFIGYGEVVFELIPSDFDELWMRGVIFIMLIAFGFYADHHTHKIRIADHEKNQLYIAMLNASHHILNNFLNNMQLFILEAESSKVIDKDLLTLYRKVIDETSDQIKSLEGIENPNHEKIEEIYKPKE
jgi:hypothetical protein